MSALTMRYHPWRHLRSLPLLVSWRRLADDVDALYDHARRMVTIDPRLNQAERRSALAHELVHFERGDTEQHCPVLAGRQERVADDTAARRLITMDQLVDSLLWAQDEHELADELWVDVATVRARLASLTEDEKDTIERHIAAREGAA